MVNESNHYDVIVIGVGGMGSAAVYQLAKRGHKVLGLEQFDIPHDMGSSHGLTRIIRLAYYEDPAYVPLLARAYELWREIEDEAGEKLLHITGSVDAGPPDDIVFEGSRRSCELHGLPHQVLTSAELAGRFPGYRLPPQTMALFQPDGGFLLSGRSIVAHVLAAQSYGADVHGREEVMHWEPTADGILVRSTRAAYTARKLVITAGAWASILLAGLDLPAVPERQVLIWMQPIRPERFTPDCFPVFNLMVDEGRYYGFPVYGIPGFKLGLYHHLQQKVDPDVFNRNKIALQDEEVLRVAAERYFPDAAGPTMSLKTCMFTNTPDEHFIIDVHPDYPQVCFAAGFSGHGFKFCSVVGEIMADFVESGATRHDIGFLRLARPALSSY